MRIRTALATVTVAAAALTGCAAPATTPTAPAKVSYDLGPRYAPCVTEETGPEFPPCYYNAKVRGNGSGHSFIWDGRTVTYVP
jgi:hypothetical protein